MPFIVFIISLYLGPFAVSPQEVFRIALSGLFHIPYDCDELTSHVVMLIRLPRLCLALVAGASLAVSGAVFQGIFKNPLASPYTLGVSSGAGFGASLGLLWSVSPLSVHLLSVAGGLCSVFITCVIARRFHEDRSSLILTGMLISTLFSSLIMLIKFVADPLEKLPQIEFWLMGSLGHAQVAVVGAMLLLSIPLLLVLFGFRWKLNVLALGDVEARAFGVDVTYLRTIIIMITSILTALVVSCCGILGWVGVVVPHLARMLVGVDYRKLLIASMSIGASYLLLIDDFCHTLIAAEIPLGVVTGIIGAPLFLYLLCSQRRRMN